MSKPIRCPKCKATPDKFRAVRTTQRKGDVRRCYICTGCGAQFADAPDANHAGAAMGRRYHFFRDRAKFR